MNKVRKQGGALFMKKMAAAVATGILFAGVTISSVSAAEVKVHKGDTLWGISKDNNTSVEELMDLNNLQSTTIHPNQILVTSESGSEQYTVKKGDTLSAIGYEFGVTVQSLKESNKLTSDIITIGQVLSINGGSVPQATTPVTEEPKEEVVEEPKEEVQEEPKAEVVEEPKEEVQEEPKAEVVEESKEEVQEEPKAEVVEEPKEEVEEAPKEEIEVKEEPKEETKSENVTPESTNQASSENTEGETISVSATAYTAECNGCSGVTSTGVDLNANPDAKVIAVDPSVIPLGSKVHVEGYGYATAADTGGAIQGNKIDVHVPSKDQAHGWGVKTVNVTIVE